MADFEHINYTDELNRIIVALTGIRDNVRLMRRLGEDPESGLVTSNVLNDFQRAMLTISMSESAASIASAIKSGASSNGGGVADPSGDSNADLATERASILEALGQDPETKKVLIREAGIYYWEAEATPGPDDGLRGSTKQVVPFAQGEQLGFDDEISGSIISGPSQGPPTDFPNPSKPRKRWPFTRTAGTAAQGLANANADLVDAATGQVVGKTIEEQQQDIATDTTTPPAIDYEAPPTEEPPAEEPPAEEPPAEEPPAEEPPAEEEESQFPFIHPEDSAYNIHTFDTGDRRVDYVDRNESPFQLPASEGEFVVTRTNDQGGQIIIYVFQATDQIWFPYTIEMYKAESGSGVPFEHLDNIVRQPV